MLNNTSLLFADIKNKTDETLVQLVSEGNKKAFDELYRRYSRKMHFFFYKMLRNDRDKADDFLQDLFLKLIEKPDRFNPQMKFSSWFYQVAGNMCRNEYRRVSVRNEIKTEEDHWHPETGEDIHRQMDHETLLKELNGAIQALEEEPRMICVLRFYEEMSVAEIAKIMNCPEGTVKSRIYYTVKKLSEKLKTHQPDV